MVMVGRTKIKNKHIRNSEKYKRKAKLSMKAYWLGNTGKGINYQTRGLEFNPT